jgi:3-(3-hydroxy-phenyl)propionate hydroxylase
VIARSSVDVAIVGFGPVGATLAGLLGRRGISVAVVERDPDVFPLPRAAHIDHTGMRVLQELKCLDELLAEMVPNRGLDFVTASRELLMRIPGDQGSVSGLPASMYFHQPEFDRTLRRAAAALPSVHVTLGAEVIGLRQTSPFAPDGGGATVILSDLDGGVISEISARWVVGCDGSWSIIRESVGMTLESLGFDERWIVVDVVLAEEIPGLPDHGVHVCDPARPHTAIPMPGLRYRFELMTLPGEDVDVLSAPAGIRSLLASWLAPEQYEIERAAAYTFHGLLSSEWRRGQVFVAGDAAHQMPPFLGQGMCSGMRDAANLAWKLAQVIQWGGEAGILDTYGLERGPHVRTIVQAAVDFGEVICLLDPRAAAERDDRILGGSPLTQRPFKLPRLAEGPLIGDGGGEVFVQPVIGEERLDDIVGQRFLVLATDASQLGHAGTWWSETVGARVATTAVLDDADGALARWLARREASVVVVRPDRYVLAAGHDLADITDAVRPLLGRIS